jgi:serine/threonine protein kinase
MPPVAQDTDVLVDRLASLDDRSDKAPTDDTVVTLKAELDTLADDIRWPAAEVPFEKESACGTVTAMVQAIGHDPLDLVKATVDLPRGDHSSAVAKELPIGTLGVYELLTKLGEGGMGAVYKARHTKLDKIVAIKVLPAERMKVESAVARFEREMRAVGKLEHPNIVRAMDANEEGGMHYLVMEYVQGVDLAQLVKQCGPLPTADACELIRQAAVGLDEAHDNAMVHRDIKPSNIMLCVVSKRKPPVVKILDMGLALLSEAHSDDVQGLTATGQMMGTFDYMAPEQGGDSKSVDIRADIYALGASLYKLLCGEVIYHGDMYHTPVQKMMALATQPAPPIQTRCQGVPDGLAAVLHQMLEKDPDKRIATPEEVAKALTPFCAGANLAALVHRAGFDVVSAPSQPDVDTDVSVVPLKVTAKAAVPPSNKAAASASPGRRRPPRLPVAIGGGLLGFGGIIALAAAVFFLQTSHGTLRVEINDPLIEVVVKGNDVVLKQADTEEISLAPGEHALVVTRGDFSFETGNFELKKGETTTVKIDLLPGRVEVVSGGHVIGQTTLVAPTAAPTAIREPRVPPVSGPKPTDVQSARNEARSPTPGASPLPPTGQAYPGKFALHIPVRSDAYVEVPTCTASTVADYYLKQKKSMTAEIWVKRDRETGMGPHQQYLGIPGWGVGSASGAGYIEGGEVGGRGAAPVRFFGAHGPLQNQRDAAVWIHIAAVEEFGKERRLYINGHLVDSVPCEPGSWGAGGGGKWGQTLKLGGSMVGLLGEARLSTTARYDKNFTPQFNFKPDEHTLALYHVDEGTGDVLKDSSGNNHHGEIVGAQWVQPTTADPGAD